MDRSGVPGIRGVYALPTGGSLTTVISIEQQYGGHARQVGRVASGLLQNMCRLIVIVDADIDPSSSEDVLWAIATRSDPQLSFEIQAGCPSGTLDPMISPERKRRGEMSSSRAVIDACRPWEWRHEFPSVNRASDQLRAQTYERWAELFS
jgi:4-hydroxy-3-polyprenylbenzoate decarboxylase